MPIYRKMKESDCENDIDKWIFNLSNMETMKTTLPFTNDIPLFKQLGKIASYSNLSPEQQVQYDDSFNNYLAFMGQQEYKLKEGIKIGREEGEKIGMEKGARAKAIESARIAKSIGLPIDQIILLTGLTAEDIDKL